MRKIVLILTICELALTGCGYKVETYEYYKTHIDEAAAVLKECKSADRSNQDINQNCLNASRALDWRFFENSSH